jgi:hypothetical protein
VSSAGKDCAPLDRGLGCGGTPGVAAPGCGTGAAEADGGAADADCWPRVLVVTAVMKRRAASSFVVTAPETMSDAVTSFFL